MPPPVILVVDDELLVVDAAAAILRLAGYDVFSALSANEALAFGRSRKEPVDVLLTDLIMPGFNGAELAACLQHLWPSVRILYMSGYPLEKLSARGITITSERNFLRKPFTPADLKSKVSEALTAPTCRAGGAGATT